MTLRKIFRRLRLNRPTSQVDAEVEFWNWFIRHETELFDFDPQHEVEREKIFDKLAGEIQKIDRDLSFEFGPKEATREFVVSASGIKRAFPAVASLVGHAPILSRWKVTAFRPRRPPSTVEFRGKSIDPDDVEFSLLDDGKIAGIYLFLPGFHEKDADLKMIGYLFLDTTLGEFDVETRLGLIKMLPPESPTGLDRYPLADLPELFDGLTSRLEGRAGQPPN